MLCESKCVLTLMFLRFTKRKYISLSLSLSLEIGGDGGVVFRIKFIIVCLVNVIKFDLM